MRIISEWTKDDIRVTVFHMNGRYSIKLEKELLEQTYKFRDGQFNSLDELKAILSDEFYSTCQSVFNAMIENKMSSIAKKNIDSEFDEII